MRKLNMMIIAGLIVAVIGAAVVIVYGRSVDNRIADGKATVQVLVAKTSIPAGESAEALGSLTEVRSVPRHYLVVSPLASLGDVAGKFLTSPVPAGGQLSSLLFGATPTSNQAVAPTRGHVAVAIQVALTPGVAKYVAPGSRVDMFVTYGSVSTGVQGSGTVSATSPTTANITFKAKSLEQQTKLFASGVKVLSVTPASADTASDGSSQATVSPGDQVIAVLELTPQLAQKVVNATTLGSIYLGLDAVGDVHRTSSGATPRQVVQSSDIVRPTK